MSMKDLSLYLLKNSFGSKMKKGFRNFCNGENSTSTLDHHHKISDTTAANGPITLPEHRRRPTPPLVNSPAREHTTTLEEMILQIEMEERMARIKAAGKHSSDHHHHRMSCVNSSDILRSARNALNQYPRFSLDGKDAMYRSSFTGRGKIGNSIFPAVVGGESVVWCKPGVVGKLMGLDAMPVPVGGYGVGACCRERVSAAVRRRSVRRRTERVEMERRRSSCSRMAAGYCSVVNKPVQLEVIRNGEEAGWPMRRFI